MLYREWPDSIEMCSLVHLGISLLHKGDEARDLSEDDEANDLADDGDNGNEDISFLSSPSVFPNLQRLTLVAYRPYQSLCQNIASSLSKRRAENSSLSSLVFNVRENSLGKDRKSMDELEKSLVLEKVEWRRIV